ncbi:FAD-dependent monooxygenase [Aetokthonos hydrillicola Thurmond2011]|jgi:2-polyprenyl-6-methoxyphenol hydroxylase-like FAD-dependent oxidoreductase|uniref:FAD-dependent monooxygenase n=1 Tax=Aetokthonos hydrillicola Thurmond2011 TaxID=2712845 RepID=A0AAP5MAX5_9CYAN|nr:FAD-dependent monooxygenase [Aetokthonos hydrillicola]MBO3458222.1 FAD-binding protein [Aetokthonos hydrillicola CCALA 1050]MBW4584441.1 FAD-dependent monooxygenase [Aetokthonos hydrillicola CCALA 1050]MDR9896403.1 FAD-dependent monooxygenase [Aetokthonos hydrillicola Thurmond2011]
MNDILETDVLIIGGGPVGLALAVELRYQGIDCILIEQTDGEVTDPKVSTVGPRSMEFCRRWGIAQQIRDAGWPANHTLDIAWVTSVGGHEIYRVHFPCYAERSLPDYSPELEQVCPQNWFAPVFLNHLGQYPQGSLRLLSRLDSFEQTNDGVIAQVTNLEKESKEVIHARYMVACDGARSMVRKACGVEAPTFHSTQVFQSVVFKAPELASQLGLHNAMVFYLVNPTIQEPLRAVDGNSLYRLILKPQQDGQMRDANEAIRAAISIDTPIEIVSNMQWRLTHRVADHFRSGRVFFVGDSAHTLSPSGGFGMNTGIGDAVDLGWKLAATLKGWAPPELLNTYEIERRPIAVRNMEEANANLQRTQKRAIPPIIMQDSPEGEQLRSSMAEGMERSNVKREFDAPGVHFGFRYESPVVIPDEATPPGDDPHQWKQSSYPGCRAPHAWLEPGKSTLDLFGHGFVLMCFDSSLQEVESFVNACQQKRVPIISQHSENPEIAKLYERSYVLVRPDGHVAWRGNTLPKEPTALIDRVRGCF